MSNDGFHGRHTHAVDYTVHTAGYPRWLGAVPRAGEDLALDDHTLVRPGLLRYAVDHYTTH